MCESIGGIHYDQYQNWGNNGLVINRIQFYTNNLNKVCSHSRYARTCLFLNISTFQML